TLPASLHAIRTRDTSQSPRPDNPGTFPAPRRRGDRMTSRPMPRRSFLTLLGASAAAWPLAARGQQNASIRRIGVMMGLAENDPEWQSRRTALVQGLRDLGWTEGRNFRMEGRGIVGGGIDRVRSTVAEVVASNPDLLYGTNTVIVQEMRRQTHAIPIVFANIGDPVATGVVTNLARPGGNATGFMINEQALGGKWLELLKEV